MDIKKIKNLGQLKKSGYTFKSIKEELRSNLILKLKSGEKIYRGILGFDETVIPDMERAILSQHNILLLGLRGQAKTRLARLTTDLLDEYMPIIADSEINDNPLAPISIFGRMTVADKGDATPIEWVHRDERYVEKLATPDVSIADLIGDVDPIKAASLMLPYSDERVIHFGLIPRGHRSIFVINELPDLQARIQVALFNILQEGDLQIRGFKFRLPLDICFIFTANPEDYTQRGSIITPLKDRIESQILTHYPLDLEVAKQITEQEAQSLSGTDKITTPDLIRDLIELVAFEARDSDYVDDKSGVSARMSIASYENLMSTAERRMILNKESKTTMRLTDMWGVIPAMTGKLELVYEGEQEGAYTVALHLIGLGIQKLFLDHFPDPNIDSQTGDAYGAIKMWFANGNSLVLSHDLKQKDYEKCLDTVPGLAKLVDEKNPDKYILMELILHGLAESKIISKNIELNQLTFGDDLADLLKDLN